MAKRISYRVQRALKIRAIKEDRAKQDLSKTDEELKQEMVKCIALIERNYQHGLGTAKSSRYAQLWARYAVYEHIVDNHRSDLRPDDLIEFERNCIMHCHQLLKDGNLELNSINVV